MPLLKVSDVQNGFDYAKTAMDDVSDERIKSKMQEVVDYAWKTWVDPENAAFNVKIWTRFDI